MYSIVPYRSDGKRLKGMEYKIYLKETKQWIPVPEQFYMDYRREIDAYQKQQKRRNGCFCPHKKKWLCNMCCSECNFQGTNDTTPIDEEINDEEEICLMDVLIDPNTDVEKTAMKNIEIDVLNSEIEKLDAAGKRICELMKHHSVREAAKLMGIPASTFESQWENIKKELRKKLKDWC